MQNKLHLIFYADVSTKTVSVVLRFYKLPIRVNRNLPQKPKLMLTIADSIRITYFPFEYITVFFNLGSM